MSNTYTTTGLVATTPRNLITVEGLSITSFRLASSVKKWNRTSKEWVDETNWLTITSFEELATHTAKSISKGDRVVVSGRLYVRDWDNGERSGTSVELEAETIGHDLFYGTSDFVRTTVIGKTSSIEEPIIV
jgi:single-strand DNA-binding protein